MILGFLIVWEYSESLSYNKENFLGTVFLAFLGLPIGAILGFFIGRFMAIRNY